MFVRVIIVLVITDGALACVYRWTCWLCRWSL